MYYACLRGCPPPRTGPTRPNYPTARPGRRRHDGELGLQNEREWASFCGNVLQQPDLASDPRFTANSKRVAERDALRRIIVEAFRPLTGAQVVERLELAQIANARVNTMQDLWAHPQLKARGRWTDIGSPKGSLPAMLPPGSWDVGPRMDPARLGQLRSRSASWAGRRNRAPARIELSLGEPHAGSSTHAAPY